MAQRRRDARLLVVLVLLLAGLFTGWMLWDGGGAGTEVVGPQVQETMELQVAETPTPPVQAGARVVPEEKVANGQMPEVVEPGTEPVVKQTQEVEEPAGDDVRPVKLLAVWKSPGRPDRPAEGVTLRLITEAAVREFVTGPGGEALIEVPTLLAWHVDGWPNHAVNNTTRADVLTVTLWDDVPPLAIRVVNASTSEPIPDLELVLLAGSAQEGGIYRLGSRRGRDGSQVVNPASESGFPTNALTEGVAALDGPIKTNRYGQVVVFSAVLPTGAESFDRVPVNTVLAPTIGFRTVVHPRPGEVVEVRVPADLLLDRVCEFTVTRPSGFETPSRGHFYHAAEFAPGELASAQIRVRATLEDGRLMAYWRGPERLTRRWGERIDDTWLFGLPVELRDGSRVQFDVLVGVSATTVQVELPERESEIGPKFFYLHAHHTLYKFTSLSPLDGAGVARPVLPPGEWRLSLIRADSVDPWNTANFVRAGSQLTVTVTAQSTGVIATLTPSPSALD